jgi:hypothetical protein
MNINAILEYFTLFFSGILAGLETAIHYGFHGPTIALDEKPQIVLRQGVVRTLRWLVPAFFVPTALCGIGMTLLDGAGPGLFFRLGALLAIIVWIFVRVVGTVHINSATLDWDSAAPPKDWKEQIARAERFHIIGTWAAILMFAFFLIAIFI